MVVRVELKDSRTFARSHAITGHAALRLAVVVGPRLGVRLGAFYLVAFLGVFLSIVLQRFLLFLW